MSNEILYVVLDEALTDYPAEIVYASYSYDKATAYVEKHKKPRDDSDYCDLYIDRITMSKVDCDF